MPPLTDPLYRAAHGAACALLDRAAEFMPAAPVGPIQVHSSFHRVTVIIEPIEGTLTGQAPGRQPGRQPPGTGQAPAGRVADAIRAVLAQAERPLKLATIAHRAGKRPTNHFRAVMRRLCAAGEVRHLDDGEHRYWLAARVLPGATG